MENIVEAAFYPKRKGIRIKDYDYNQNGAYFVTVCAEKMRCLFGKVEPDIVGANCVRPVMSNIGKIIESEIHIMSNTYDDVFVDKYVIMPNHVHMIIMLEIGISGRTQFAPTISRMIKQFKGSVTKKLDRPIWQKSFYDHVIRNEKDYLRIWEYIEYNPLRWVDDECYNANTAIHK